MNYVSQMKFPNFDDTFYVKDAEAHRRIDNLPSPMVFKGTLGTNGTITSLPAAAPSNEGFTYKVITAGTYATIEAKVGDVFISNGSAWILVPSGDDVEDTWRNIKVNNTELLGTGISTGAVNFKNGGNVAITGSGNDITIAATDTNTTYTLSQDTTDGHKITLTPSEGSATTITIPDMTGATSSTAGSAGLVPAPAAGDQNKYLQGNGTWANVASIEIERETVTATAGQSSISIPSTLGITNANALAVYQNGLLLTPTTNYTVASDLSAINLVGYEAEAGDIFTFVARVDVGMGTYITNPQVKANGQFLKYNGSTWVADNVPSTSVSLESGTDNGTLKLTVNDTETDNIKVKGLGSAAYTDSAAYATAAQGAKADSALQSHQTVTLSGGSGNGTLKLTTAAGTSTDITVTGLKSAAYTPSSDYATAAQGTKADNAQPASTAVKYGGSAVGGAGQPVYIDANGNAVACTTTSIVGYPSTSTKPSANYFVWNTEYRLGDVNGALALGTLPTPNGSISQEIRIGWRATGTPSVTMAAPSGYTLYGLSDVSVTANKYYELSVAVFASGRIGVACKEWA